MADTLDQFCATACTQLPDHAFALMPITGVYPYLEQFMVGQGQFDLPLDRLGQARATDNDYRFQVMPQTAQMPLLTFRECHGCP